jgi:hypothetical protein
LPFVVWFCGKIDTLNKTEDSKFCQQINWIILDKLLFTGS